MTAGVFLETLTPFYRGDNAQPHPARPERALVDTSPAAAGTVTDSRPLDIRSIPRTGARAASFFDDYYNRVHLIPTAIDFGPVASATDRQATLWNAYLTSTTLTAIGDPQDGVVISGVTTPAVIAPLATRILNVHVNEAGPATISAAFALTFSTPDALLLTVTGQRARLWPFKPNWRETVDVTPEYRTDIITSRSGKEQRRSLRRVPRRVLSFTTTLFPEDRQRFIRLLTQWQARPITLPDPTRSLKLTVGSPADAGIVTIYDRPYWIAEGAQLLVGDALATVSDVSDDLVTFSPANPDALLPGTVIRPTLTGLLSGSISAEHPVSRVAEARITFAVDPGSETFDEGQPGLYIHGGREVLTKRPDWSDRVDQVFEWPTDPVDFGHGRLSTFVPVTQGWFTQQASYLSISAAQVAEIESFFYRMRGRRGEFHMPTWMDDIQLAAGMTLGTTTLRAAGTDVYDQFREDTRYRSVAVILKDGRLLLRTIANMYLSGGDTILDMTGEWLMDIAADEVAMVCWMPVFRFNSDTITTSWQTDEVAKASLSARSLEELPAENPITGLDGAAQWLLENWGPDGTVPLDRLDYAVNVRYPAIFWWPLAWVMVHESVVDSFDNLVNVEIPESIG